MKRATYIIISLLCGFIPAAGAQRPGAVIRETSKPTVYLTFERFGENDSVWLRLHNNTEWGISFRTEHAFQGESVAPLALSDGRGVPGLSDGLEITPEYFIEHATDKVTTNAQSWCTAVNSWLPPGHSVVFGFPRGRLKAWEEIYVKFTYEWERGKDDPEHRVKFQGFD